MLNPKLIALITTLILLFFSIIFVAITNKDDQMPILSNKATAPENFLLHRTDHPAFKQITSAQFEPAIDKLIADFQQTLTKILALTQHNWNNTIQPMEEKSEALERVWNIISHLNSVNNTNETRIAYEKVLAKLTTFHTDLMQNEHIYAAYNAIKSSAEFNTLNHAQQTLLTDALRNFKLSGVALPLEKRERFKKIQQALSELSNKFSNNILDASQEWSYLITPENQTKLNGLPEHTINIAKAKAEQKQQTGWLLTLDHPCYNAILTFADDAELRKIFYEAYTTRASDQGPLAGKWDNSTVMLEILKLRQEEAQLLGYANYAEYSLATKMAKHPEQVMHFLNDLVTRSLAQGTEEYQQLVTFAKEKFNQPNLEAWDLGYYAERYKQALHNISEEQLRPYFSEEKVLSGLFNLANRLFGISITPVTNVEIWHDQVRVFAVKDQQQNLRGMFYADLYARENKKSGAWMADLFSRMRYTDGQIQVPIAFLVANLTPPSPGKPALLSHDETQTLFHEFGHTLQHILTNVDYFSVSGTKNVAWDAVELPSQFMENWGWEWEVVKDLSEHYQTKESLPKDLFDKLSTAKNFQSALAMLRQLQFAIFDFRLHLNAISDQNKSIQQILDEVRKQTSVFAVPTFNRFQHSFSHIFAGGYAAGYYSYLWAEVLSSDAFAKFKAHGTFDPQIGQEFLHAILEPGGSYDAMELFVKFMGREPKIDALLASRGIK